MNYKQKITSLAQELEETMNHSNEIMDEIIETVVEQAMVDALTDAFSKLSDEEQLAIVLNMLSSLHHHHRQSNVYQNILICLWQWSFCSLICF